MGKKNKVVKLTDRKLSPSSVKRVWMHWTKTEMPLIIKKFGRKRNTLDGESVDLILEVHKVQNFGARRLETIAVSLNCILLLFLAT